MHIQQLHLEAFGHFTDFVLDFSQKCPGFHVIYGLNEAGKSTTRRALSSLLFGIPERTQDAFFHANQRLRLGAILQNAQGEQLQCYRRKGRKNTLLDSDNSPLDEKVVQAYLGHMSEAQFCALFCFDHDRLKQGGEDLLKGDGNVGESLFEAGTGSLKLHELLESLDKEAGDLFNARATKPLLNQSIKQYKEAKQRIKNCSLSANLWSEHSKKLAMAQQQDAELLAQLHALRTEQLRLERIQRTRPAAQRRQELLEEFKEVEHAVLLPDDTTAKRIRYYSDLSTAQVQEQQAQESIAELEQQVQHIHIPDKILAQKVAIDNLRERLGSHQKAAKDLPGVRTEMRTVEAEAEALLHEIYPQHELAQLPELVLSHPQREKLKQLADEYPSLREKQAQLKERLVSLKQQLTQQQHALQALATPYDITLLQTSLAQALKQGDLEEHIAKDERELRLLKVKADIGLKQLGLWSGDLETLEQSVLPNAETIDKFDRQFKKLASDKQRTEERLAEVRHQHNQVVQKIETLQWTHEVPTEEALAKARKLRQQCWEAVKRAECVTESVSRDFEEVLLYADELSDRLYREAERVAEHGMLQAEKQKLLRKREQQVKLWHYCNSEVEKLTMEWEHCWEELGIKPWSPEEMRTWTNECLHLRQQMSLYRERLQQVEERQTLLTTHCQQLKGILQQLQPEHAEQIQQITSLVTLIDHAQDVIDETQELKNQRHYLEKQIKQLEQEQQQLLAAQAQLAAIVEQWQTEWTTALTPLQLPVDTLPDVVRDVLDTLDQANHKLEKAKGLKRRVDLMNRDAEAFQSDVAALLNIVAPELLHEKVEHSVPTLANGLNQAEKDATRYAELEKNLRLEKKRLTEARKIIQTAQTQLQILLDQAHCQDLVDLEFAEQTSEQKKALQRQLNEIEQYLLEQGEGLSLEELTQAADEVEIDALPHELEQVKTQIQQLEKERSEVIATLGEQRVLLKQMDGNDAAAQAAEEAQLALSEIRALSERYMQLHLASVVLRQAIEKYREQHQGPLLQRASELFQRLTLGSFMGLKVGYQGNDDEPILLGLRANDNLGVSTSGMSDGTRDQLYLALRLASIENYLTTHSPLPLVLDDILINFDDARSQATLEILGELSRTTQILFFTHHQHLVKLAQQSISNKQLVIHQLSAGNEEVK